MNRFEETIERTVEKRTPSAGEPSSTEGVNYIEYDISLTSRQSIDITPELNARPLSCNSIIPGRDDVSVSVTPSLTCKFKRNICISTTKYGLAKDVNMLDITIDVLPKNIFDFFALYIY